MVVSVAGARTVNAGPGELDGTPQRPDLMVEEAEMDEVPDGGGVHVQERFDQVVR
jgi:hypothetical protein